MIWEKNMNKCCKSLLIGLNREKKVVVSVQRNNKEIRLIRNFKSFWTSYKLNTNKLVKRYRRKLNKIKIIMIKKLFHLLLLNNLMQEEWLVYLMIPQLLLNLDII